MKIPRSILDAIFARGDAAAPVEICGYLAGIGGDVVKDIPVVNAEASEEHFTMEPKEQFDVMRRVRSEGLEITAVYHTHPATPPRPSEEDIRLAYDPSPVYLIVSLAAATRGARAFRIISVKANEVELTVV